MINVIAETGCTELTRTLENIAAIYPKRADSFLKKEGTKLRTQVARTTRQMTTKRTGNLLDGILRSKRTYMIEGNKTIRVYNTANHAHLIEYGHRMVNGNKSKAYLPMHSAADTFMNRYYQDVSTFVDKIFEEII